MIPSTKAKIPPADPNGVSSTPQSAPGVSSDRKTDVPAGVNLDGVSATSLLAPQGEGRVRMLQSFSATSASSIGQPVPAAATQGSTETHIADFTSAAGVPAGTAVLPAPAAPLSRVKTSSTGGASGHAPAPPAGPTAADSLTPRALAEALAAMTPLPEQTAENVAGAVPPPRQAPQLSEEGNRLEKQASNRGGRSTLAKSPGSVPGDGRLQEPETPAPTAPADVPVPPLTAVLDPPSVSAPAPTPGSEPHSPEKTTVSAAAQSRPAAEAPILAFSARLAPLTASDAAPAKPALPPPETVSSELVPARVEAAPARLAPLAAGLAPAPAPQPPARDGTVTGSEEPANSVPASQHPQADVVRQAPKFAEPDKARATPDSVSAPASPQSAPPANPGSPAIPSITSASDTPSQPHGVTTPEPAPREPRTETESPAEPAKPSAAARDIQVQVNRGEQRVDVRLTERSGEVLVAVRTPDPQLAGALREDLGVLSSRLEQAGFRAETWHPATPASENPLRTAESHSSNTSSQDQNPSRHGGQEQQQPPPRQPKTPAAQAATSSPRKEFAWLMSQLP